MSGPIVVLLFLLAAVAVVAMVGTIVVIVRDGRGNVPKEHSERPWMAGNLPSVPYSPWHV
jgi:hypothetical protein